MTREEAIYTLKNAAWLGTHEERVETEQAIDMAIETLSAEAVEVVRCKECRHSRIEGDTTMFMWCGYWNKPTDGIRYCSDGERREP